MRTKKKARTSTTPPKAICTAILNIVLLTLGEQLGEYVCVYPETYTDIKMRVYNICPESIAELDDKWKHMTLIRGPRGLKLTRRPSLHGSTVICRELSTTRRSIEELQQTDIDDVESRIINVINIIDKLDETTKLVVSLNALFTLNLDSVRFKHALKAILQALLPRCKTRTEYPLATSTRLDVYVECPFTAVAIELKTPKEGTAAYASHNPVRQLQHYIELLTKLHRDKYVAAILIRTDGKTPMDFISAAMRENIPQEIREKIHILSIDNLNQILKETQRILGKEEKLTPERLLELIAQGRIDTIKLAANKH